MKKLGTLHVYPPKPLLVQKQDTRSPFQTTQNPAAEETEGFWELSGFLMQIAHLLLASSFSVCFPTYSLHRIATSATTTLCAQVTKYQAKPSTLSMMKQKEHWKLSASAEKVGPWVKRLRQKQKELHSAPSPHTKGLHTARMPAQDSDGERLTVILSANKSIHVHVNPHTCTHTQTCIKINIS